MVAVLALTGCAPAQDPAESEAPTTATSPGTAPTTSVPTPESTSQAQSAPTTAEDAIAGSTAAVNEYIAQWVTIRNSSTIDPQTIAALAIDQGSSTVSTEAQKFRDAGITVTGGLTYEPDGNALPNSATVDGTEMEFGSVQMSGCLDTTEIAGTNADGSEASTSSDKRYVWEFVTIYVPSANRWMVSHSDLPEVRASC